MMKKYLVPALCTIALAFGVLSAKTAFAAGAGDLVKCADFPAVYLLGEDGKRYVFPNERIFESWYKDFGSVVEISCADLATFPIGGRVQYQPGTRLVKLISSPKVYAVESDGVLREIPSENVAKKLFGDDWAKRVDDLSDAFWPGYTLGTPLLDDEIPEGTTFVDADGTLYRTDDDGTAVEVSTLADDEEKSVLAKHALARLTFEHRFGRALHRLRSLDAEDRLQKLLERLHAVRVDDADVVEVPDVEEIGGSQRLAARVETLMTEVKKLLEISGSTLPDAETNSDWDGARTLIHEAESLVLDGKFVEARQALQRAKWFLRHTTSHEDESSDNQNDDTNDESDLTSDDSSSDDESSEDSWSDDEWSEEDTPDDTSSDDSWSDDESTEDSSFDDESNDEIWFG